MSKCNVWGVLLGLIVIVFTLWTPVAWASWLVVAAGIIILLHAFGCCKYSCNCETKPINSKPKRKKSKR